MGAWDVISTNPSPQGAGTVDPWAVTAQTPQSEYAAFVNHTATPGQLALGSGGPGGVLQGVFDTGAGLVQLAGHGLSAATSLGGRYPNAVSNTIDKVNNAVDNTVTSENQYYENAKKAAGNSGPDLARAAGFVVSPVTGALSKAAGLIPRVADAIPETLAGSKLLAGGAKTAADIAQGAGIGGGFGATAPVTDQSQPFWQQKGRQAESGAALGGALSAAAPVALGAYNGAKNAVNAFRPAGQENIVGRILNESAGTLPATPQEPPLPGMQLTTGQATNNPGLLWLERSVQQSNPAAAEAMATSRTSNNQAVRSAITSLGDTNSDASAAMADRIAAADESARAKTGAMWQAAGIDDKTGIPASALKDQIDTYVSGLKIAERKNIPPEVLSTLDDIAQQGDTNLGEIQAWRSDVAGQMRQAARIGNGNQARILGGLYDNISGFLDNLPGMDTEAYNAARAATKADKETFNQPAAVRNVLGTDRFGADKVPVSATADQFIRTGRGAPEALNSYLNAAGNDPQALQAARDAFTQKFLGSVETTQPDLQGDGFVSPAKVTKFLGDYSHVVNSPLFTDAQRNLMQHIGDASDMGARTARAGAPGGSDTFAKLSGKNFIDALIGPMASKVMPVGGAVLGAHFGLTEGGVGGALAGLWGGNHLAEMMYAAPREKVLNLLNEAMSDPKLAQALMQKVRPGSDKLIPQGIKNRIFGILGSEPVESHPLVSQNPFNRSPGFVPYQGNQESAQ